jgi:hypothetical protein
VEFLPARASAFFSLVDLATPSRSGLVPTGRHVAVRRHLNSYLGSELVSLNAQLLRCLDAVV